MSGPSNSREVGAAARFSRGAALLTLGVALALVALSLILATAFWTLMFVPYAVMGFLVVWQQPRNTVGWALLATGFAFSIQGLLSADAGVTRHLPVGLEAAMLPMQALPFTLLITVVVLFPDGRVDSRLQRAALVMCAVVATVISLGFLTNGEPMWSGRVNPVAVEALQGVNHVLTSGGAFLTVPVLIGLGLASLITRWRRSTGLVRQQYRWLGFGVSVTLLGLLILLVTNFSTLGLVLGPLGIVFLPVAMGIAVTRHGLYDIDRIISRTVSYAIVTGALLAVYAAIVVSASHLLDTKSPVVVAAATLTAAALARPLLSRVQSVVDHRFDRARYDALQTVDEFGARLRHQVDPEAVLADLSSVVRQTLQPAHAVVTLVDPP